MKKAWPLLVAVALVALASGFYISWRNSPPPAEVKAAKALGLTVKENRLLNSLADRSASGTMDQQGFTDLIGFSHNENPDVRLRAFSSIYRCKSQELRPKAIAEVERMKTDEDERIREKYAQALYKLDAPNWQEEWKKYLDSPDPQLKERAEALLGQ